MTKAKKKRLSKFNFEDEGAAVALVSPDQGGPANGVTTLLTKATKDVKVEKASEEDIQKAASVNLNVTLIDFLTRYMGLWIDDAEVVAGMLGVTYEDLYGENEMDSWKEVVESNLETAQVSKTASKNVLNKAKEAFSEYLKITEKATGQQTENQKEVSKMTKETENQEVTVTDESVQEMIQKALKDQEAEIRKSLSEEFEQKDKERSAELDILKAKEDAREQKAFIAKAADYKEHLASEETEQHEAVEALAKALRKADADEEMQPLVALAKSLKDTVEKSALMDEVGGVSVEKASQDGYDTEGDKLVQKMVSEEGMTESAAYAKLLTDRPELFQ